MEQLIQDVFEIIQDYRADEGRQIVKVTPERIKLWVNQFEEVDREFILTELKSVFEKRYFSKEDAKMFLKQIIEVLAKDLKYTSIPDFLKDCIFLDLQPNGKSQKKMLSELDSLLQENYGLSLVDCGSNSKKHFVYVDDVLCTGKTLSDDIQDWCKLEYSPGETNLDALKKSSANLIFAYIFIHLKNYYKKKAEFAHKIDAFLRDNHKMYRMIEVDNSDNFNSKLDMVFPLEAEQTQAIEEYKEQIKAQVDNYTDNKGYKKSNEEFFRAEGKPQTETLFTSAENRKRFEKIILQKGIEILKNANANIPNMRALGYSLPSQKNFGFGTLCFTWRNVANNTPLVFWYKGGGFTPLFEKNQTNTQNLGNFVNW